MNANMMMPPPVAAFRLGPARMTTPLVCAVVGAEVPAERKPVVSLSSAWPLVVIVSSMRASECC